MYLICIFYLYYRQQTNITSLQFMEHAELFYLMRCWVGQWSWCCCFLRNRMGVASSELWPLCNSFAYWLLIRAHSSPVNHGYVGCWYMALACSCYFVFKRCNVAGLCLWIVFAFGPNNWICVVDGS